MTSDDGLVVIDNRAKEVAERAARHIRSILDATVARGLVEVGRYILKEFFDDDPSLCSVGSHRRPASLRMLEDMCESVDLPVRRSFLSSALRLEVLSRQMPPGSAFLSLPPSHRVELLPLRTIDRMERVAEVAMARRLSVQRLRSVVRKEKQRWKSPRGRKPIPPVPKSIRASLNCLQQQRDGQLRFDQTEVDGLSSEQLADAQVIARELRSRIDELQALLSIT